MPPQVAFRVRQGLNKQTKIEAVKAKGVKSWLKVTEQIELLFIEGQL